MILINIWIEYNVVSAFIVDLNILLTRSFPSRPHTNRDTIYLFSFKMYQFNKKINLVVKEIGRSDINWFVGHRCDFKLMWHFSQRILNRTKIYFSLRTKWRNFDPYETFHCGSSEKSQKRDSCKIHFCATFFFKQMDILQQMSAIDFNNKWF